MATLLQTALEANSKLNTFVTLLRAANLMAALDCAGPFTVFAPTNRAFALLPSGAIDQLLQNPEGQLTQILLYHIVAGNFDTGDLEDETEIITLQGKPLRIFAESDGEILINNATIDTSIETAVNNGEIHVIDTVLLPPPD